MTFSGNRFSPSGQQTGPFLLADTLTQLALLTAPSGNGTRAQVLDQQTEYVLDRSNVFTPDGLYIVKSLTGAGNWFRRSKAYVVANFFAWSANNWNGNAGNARVIGFSPAQLAAGGSVTPDIVLNTSAVALTWFQLGMAVDNLGNIWVASYKSGSGILNSNLFKIPLAKVMAGGVVTPADCTVLQFDNLNNFGSWDLAFDRFSNLWLTPSTSANGSQMIRLAPAQYAVSGTVVPRTVLTSISGIKGGQGIAFDGVGNLWGAGFGSAGNTVSYATAAQLAVLGTVATVPPVIWSGTNFPANGPSAVQQGPTGAMWVSQYVTGAGNGLLNAFDPTAATGNPVPAISISSTSFNGAGACEFDRSGNAWVCNEDAGATGPHFVLIAAADLTSSGAKVPARTLSVVGTAGFYTGIRFPNNPQRSGLVASGSPIAL